MPIIVKNPTPGALSEYMMLEIQGDLQSRTEDLHDCSGKFVGDVLYNKYGNPVSFIYLGYLVIVSDSAVSDSQ